MAYIRPISGLETGDEIYISDDIYTVFFAPRLTQEQKDAIDTKFTVDIPATDGSAVRNYTFRLGQVHLFDNWKISLSGDWRDFLRRQNVEAGDLVELKWSSSDFRLFCRVFHDGLVPEDDSSLRSGNDFDDDSTKPKQTKIISDLLKAVAKFERKESRTKIRWENRLFEDINPCLRLLLEEKEAVERQGKFDMKGDFFIPVDDYESRLASIKQEEEKLLRERDRYEVGKGRRLREMKRIRDEDGSRFNDFRILSSRYALLNLLGKGGFSEVYKAYDLVDHKYVACKLHGMNPQWNEEKIQSYIRHACREYAIHKTLVHDNIVRLWDSFEIDGNTFCTVLEFCSGEDLDAVLKATPVLPEMEARLIIVQIFKGLVYLNQRAQKVIHYDLKPGNVLFDELGVAKLTDFGLSKIVEEYVGPEGIELTSPEAGTYWYLPPECFELNKIPMISSKVDVWSAGVLFYQMLFGRRPFGHDQSQETIRREGTILKAREVDFPAGPNISTEAKEFILRCLTYNQAERPDVLNIAKDPYLSYS